MTRRLPVWVFALLPVVIILAAMAGVQYHESGGTDEVFSPSSLGAGDQLAFSYDLKDDQGNPIREADVYLSLVKVSALPPSLNANYLRADSNAVGEVFTTVLHSLDGRVEFQSVVWDAGEYVVRLRAEAPGLTAPIEREFSLNAAVPLGAKARTAVFYLLVLAAGFVTGRMVASLKPPTRRLAAAALATALALVPVGLSQSHESHSPETHDSSSAGMHVRMNPSAPVQKGAPADFTIQLPGAGDQAKAEAFVSLHHTDDKIQMLSFRTGTADGQVRFSYAFPDTTDYRLSVHAVPTEKSAVPYTADFVFNVPEVQPSLISQTLALATLLLAALIGFVYGFRKERSLQGA